MQAYPGANQFKVDDSPSLRCHIRLLGHNLGGNAALNNLNLFCFEEVHKMKHIGIHFLVLFAFFHSTAHAAPLLYDESVDGDIVHWPRPDRLTLGFGINLISGNITGRDFSVNVQDNDFDIFDAYLPEGGILKSITFSTSLIGGPDRDITWGMTNAFNFTSSGYSINVVYFSDNYNTPGSSTTVLYDLERDYLRRLGVKGYNEAQSFDYTFAIDVIGEAPPGSVPVPGSLPLFGTVLAGLGWRRLKRSPST